MTAFDLLMFALSSFVMISILIWYSNRIPQKIQPISTLDKPIYNSKDLLLQEVFSQGNDFPIAGKTPLFMKLIIIILVATTPLFELFGIDNFL